jgi:ribosomal protein L7Ae-like RNA K-turn-binding protein
MNERLKGMIGLAVNAGKTLSGTFAVEGAVKRGKARLVIIDGRVSKNTLKQFELLCDRHGTKYIVLEDSGVLETLLRRDNRTVMAITDGNFASAIQEICKKDQGVQE